jgi:hypothetical protein
MIPQALKILAFLLSVIVIACAVACLALALTFGLWR